MSSISLLEIKLRVFSFRGTWTETIFDSDNRVSMDSALKFSGTFATGSKANTRIPKACASWATLDPMRPNPTRPRVEPSRSPGTMPSRLVH